VSEFLESLREHVGTRGNPQPARDAVNLAMIRHWCDAMEDANPVYTDPDYAAKSSHGELVAPPAMLNAWTMRGLIPREPVRGGATDPQGGVIAKLDAAGYSSVVASNSDHEYRRYLTLGDHLSGTLELLDVSEEKQTALGAGHFVTTQTTYRDQQGEEVGAMRFRILKFKPGTGRQKPGAAGSEAAEPAPRPLRPRPGISLDSRFFWDGVQQGELRIQECAGCQALHHPPMVRCPGCGSYELGYRVASGRGRLYSFVEAHHPQIPAFDYPLTVGLIELEEGTRLLSELIDIDAERIEIGMPLEVAFVEVERPAAGRAGWKLPLFRVARPQRRETTLRFEDVEVGQQLAPCPIPITTTRIVACALASRDYQDVHHDRELAVQRGSPDIFMNILTSSGLAGRYLSDWAGPEARLRNLHIRLGAPNYPGDCMTVYGTVASKGIVDGAGVVGLEFRGTNRLGNHMTGKTDLELPMSGSSGSE
jgi:uncharacterized OB-fold protein/acyl dehydratase